MIKTLSKMGIKGIYLNIIKAMYDKLTANIIVKGKPNSIFFKIRKEQDRDMDCRHSYST